MNRLASTGVLVTILGCALGAQAQTAPTPDAYVSVAVGPSHSNIDCSGTTSCDKTSTFAKVLLGYRLLPNLAAEASYAYLGRVKATVSDGEDTATATIKGQSLGIGIAGLLPFGSANEWTGIARVGVASNRARVSASLDGTSASDSETHTEPYFGAALNYAFTPNLEAGIAWDSTRIKYGDVSSRVNAFSVVAGFRF